MTLLKPVEPDVVEVPELSQRLITVGAALLTIIGVGIFYFLFTGQLVTGRFWLGLIAAIVLPLGVVGLCSVSRVLIDRKAGLLLKQRGWFRLTHEQRRPITPTAIRLTIKRNYTPECGETTHNTLWLVQEEAEAIQLERDGASLSKLRELAEELASFLNVEHYEDKLYRPQGLLTPKTGPGSGPTRTYPARGETVPLAVDEREEFRTEGDGLWFLTDRVNALPSTRIERRYSR